MSREELETGVAAYKAGYQKGIKAAWWRLLEVVVVGSFVAHFLWALISTLLSS